VTRLRAQRPRKHLSLPRQITSLSSAGDGCP